MYVIPCEEQSSNLFPLVEQESSQGRQMDRGEGDVEEERQARVKSAPVLPRDKEREEHEVTHATFRSWCEAFVAERATEDSHKRSATEPSVPLVAMDYGFLGRDTDVDLATILVLIQRPTVGPEPHAIDCVLAYLDAWALREVLFKADNEPAIQALVDAVRVKRGERTMVEESPKYSHQSNGAVENAVRRIESLSRTYVCVARETWLQGTRRTCFVDLSNVMMVAVRGPD